MIHPLAALRYHITGAIKRGESAPIVAITCAGCTDPINHSRDFDCTNN